jgi:HSP20 family molecular chaperone IbpA
MYPEGWPPSVAERRGLFLQLLKTVIMAAKQLKKTEPLLSRRRTSHTAVAGKRKSINQPPAFMNMDSTSAHEYIIYMAVPGMERKDFSLIIKDRKLTISAEKKQPVHCFSGNENFSYAHWSEVFSLPEDADTVMTAATYQNGELQIHIPKGTGVFPEEPTVIFIY